MSILSGIGQLPSVLDGGNASYSPYTIGVLDPTSTTLTLPLPNCYIFISATSNTTITLPPITPELIGRPIDFRRVGNTDYQLIIKTAVGSNTSIVHRSSVVESPENTNYPLLLTGNTIGNLTAISLTKWAVIL
jgi:hypothetical protein